MNKYFYIYNRHQANYFIQQGLPVLEVGKGKHDGNYTKFLRDERADEVFAKWRENKDDIMHKRNKQADERG